MQKSKFTESQIVAAIKKQESGVPVKEIVRELGINQAIFYNWKAKYGGMEVSDVRKVKNMEAGAKRVDIFPQSAKYHDITNNKRGEYQNLIKYLVGFFNFRVEKVSV